MKLQCEYEKVALNLLVYEFSPEECNAVDERIQKRLRRKRLGDFDPVRIGALRRLKNDLQKEIGKQRRSKYYDGLKGEETMAEIEDFDLPALTLAMIEKHPEVPPRVIRWFVPVSVFVYHLL